MTNKDLIEIAKNARKNAFVSISSYSVGAALLTKSGTVYLGANIEDKSIPNLSCCAERVAIQNAFSHGDREFIAIAIVGGKENNDIDETLIPCGVCLQYIMDMCSDIDIITYIDGNMVSMKVQDYLKIPYKLKN